jgi:hypothetical protein
MVRLWVRSCSTSTAQDLDRIAEEPARDLERDIQGMARGELLLVRGPIEHELPLLSGSIDAPALTVVTEIDLMPLEFQFHVALDSVMGRLFNADGRRREGDIRGGPEPWHEVGNDALVLCDSPLHGIGSGAEGAPGSAELRLHLRLDQGP